MANVANPASADDADLYSRLENTETKPARRWSPYSLVAWLASLRLTVVLFVLAFILVFAGTLAQVDAGIWTVVHTYFRTLYVWMPIQIFFPRTIHVGGGFYFPGGWAIGGALLTNLLAAHLVRFKLSWKRSGILLIHAGLIVMMLSEFITGKFAVEGTMTIVQGSTSNYLELHDQNELAITAPDGQVTTVPDKLLRKTGPIRDDRLPFDIDLVRFLTNSEPPRPLEPGETNPATAGDGAKLMPIEVAPVSGTDPDQGPDIPAVYLTFKEKGSGKALGTYLVSEWWSEYLQIFGEPKPQIVDDAGKRYEVSLRPARVYKPYTIYLKKFTHEVFKTTNIHKVFASNVRLINPETHEEREVHISMNEPLTYNGETFYQQAWLPGDTGTRLQVVHNPGQKMPYISCAMVSIGMLIHFGLHLLKFLQSRFGEIRSASAAPVKLATAGTRRRS
jgi:hypothetical protein